MSAFDDLTLAELDLLKAEVLGGKPVFSDDVDQLALSSGVMWLTKRKNGTPDLSWDDFKHQTTMTDIKEFAEEMEAAEKANPTITP